MKIKQILIFLTIINILFFSGITLKAEDVTLVAVGDIMLANRYVPYLKKYGYNFPFEYTKDITSTADIAFGNLEAPISKRKGTRRKKQFTFKQHPKTIESLKYAGFDVLNLANNHILDFGRPAFHDTLKLLQENNFTYIGGGYNKKEAEEMKILTVKGVKIGFLGFSKTIPWAYYAGKNKSGTAYVTEKRLKQIINKNKDKVDILVVSFHWGKEYTWKPRSYQVSLAHCAIDNGAHIVLGHHPHCIQPTEKYKNGIIAYSLGNFAFGSYGRPPKRKADKSLILKAFLNKKGITKVEIIPLDVYNYRIKFQSRIPESADLTKKILNHIKKINKRLKTDMTIEGDRGFIYFN